jgi:hypothetical protein
VVDTRVVGLSGKGSFVPFVSPWGDVNLGGVILGGKPGSFVGIFANSEGGGKCLKSNPHLHLSVRTPTPTLHAGHVFIGI